MRHPADAPRVAMLSVHTSPLDQPGTGDAGGMNVYVTDLARALADRGAQVEIFTRATASDQPEVVEADDGVLVRHVPAGPYEGLDKNELPALLCAFTAGVLRTEAGRAAGWYDVVHSHYWLSGQVGWLTAERWDVPLVHTMHTLAKVKNAALAPGEPPEPRGRILGEEQLVGAADALVASTRAEADDLVTLYGADPAAVQVVTPGVDLDVFHPGGEADQARRRALARRELGLPLDRDLVLFAGRVQPLKSPDVLVRALADMAAARAAGGAGAPLPLLVVLGGPSGDARAVEELLGLARALGLAGDVRVEPPVDRARLATWYRAADVVAVPSRSESFGLVAAEAQACGTPVVAAAVGGLRTVVADGVTGELVPGHDPADWAATLTRLLADPERRSLLGRAGARRARRQGWDVTAERMLAVYARAEDHRRAEGRRRAPLRLSLADSA